MYVVKTIHIIKALDEFTEEQLARLREIYRKEMKNG